MMEQQENKTIETYLQENVKKTLLVEPEELKLQEEQ